MQSIDKWTSCNSVPKKMVDYLTFCGKTMEDNTDNDETSEADDAFLESFLAKTDVVLNPPKEKVATAPPRMYWIPIEKI